MAVFRKKTVYLILFALFLLSLAIRYPLVDHERSQTDSYYIHYLSQSIVDAGFAKWTLNPLSYLGYYPLSYPSATPFILAEFSAMTGLSVESSILILNMAIATLFGLTVFCLAREFTRRVEYCLVATFFAILGPRFVDTTYWVGSARGLVVVLMAMFVFVAFRAVYMGQRRLLLFLALISFGAFSAHHMAVLLVLYGFGYVLASFGGRFLQRTFIAGRRRMAVVVSFVAVMILAIGALTYFDRLGGSIRTGYASGAFSSGPEAFVIILNIAVSYTHQIGFVLILAFLGIVVVLRRESLTTKALFPATLSLALVPIIGDSLYVSMLLSPFIATLGVMWISEAYRRRSNRSVLNVCMVVLAVGSLVLPVWSVSQWSNSKYATGDTVEPDSQMFNDAAYLQFTAGNHYAFSNSEVIGLELRALTGCKFVGSGIPSLLNGDITSKDIRDNLTFRNEDFPVNLYVWFGYRNQYFVDNFVLGLMVSGTAQGRSVRNETIRAYYQSHSNAFVIVDNHWPNQYAVTYSIQSSIFLREIRSGITTTPDHTAFQSYEIYQSSRISFFAVGLPP